MLFMAIYTYDPENRKDVIERRLQHGAMDAKSGKCLGEWSYLGGGTVFRLMETDDPKALLASTNAWGDLGRIEVYPVMETEEALKLLAKK